MASMYEDLLIKESEMKKLNDDTSSVSREYLNTSYERSDMHFGDINKNWNPTELVAEENKALLLDTHTSNMSISCLEKCCRDTEVDTNDQQYADGCFKVTVSKEESNTGKELDSKIIEYEKMDNSLPESKEVNDTSCNSEILDDVNIDAIDLTGTQEDINVITHKENFDVNISNESINSCTKLETTEVDNDLSTDSSGDPSCSSIADQGENVNLLKATVNDIDHHLEVEADKQGVETINKKDGPVENREKYAGENDAEKCTDKSSNIMRLRQSDLGNTEFPEIVNSISNPFVTEVVDYVGEDTNEMNILHVNTTCSGQDHNLNDFRNSGNSEMATAKEYLHEEKECLNKYEDLTGTNNCDKTGSIADCITQDISLDELQCSLDLSHHVSCAEEIIVEKSLPTNVKDVRKELTNLTGEVIDDSYNLEQLFTEHQKKYEKSKTARKRKKQQQKLKKSLQSKPYSDSKSRFAQSTEELSFGRDVDIDGSLTCSVCLELYYLPRSCHPCGHIFCDPCLRRLTAQGWEEVPCPLCRTVIQSCEFQQEFNEILKGTHPDVFSARAIHERHSKFRHYKLPYTPPVPLGRRLIRHLRTNSRNRQSDTIWMSNDWFKFLLGCTVGVCTSMLIMVLNRVKSINDVRDVNIMFLSLILGASLTVVVFKMFKI